jgi:hypothetical protein
MPLRSLTKDLIIAKSQTVADKNYDYGQRKYSKLAKLTKDEW